MLRSEHLSHLDMVFRPGPLPSIPFSQPVMCGIWLVMSIGVLMANVLWGIGFIAIGILIVLYQFNRSITRLTITADTHQLKVRRSGLRPSRHVWLASEIKSILADQGRHEGQMSEMIFVEDVYGKRNRLIAGLPSRFASTVIAHRLLGVCQPAHEDRPNECSRRCAETESNGVK